MKHKKLKLYALPILLVVAFISLVAGASVTWVIVRTDYEPEGYDWDTSYVIFDLPEFVDCVVAMTGDQYIGHAQDFEINVTNVHDQGMTLISYDLTLDWYDYHEAPQKLENIFTVAEVNPTLVTDTNTYIDAWVPQHIATDGFLVLTVTNCVWG